MTDTSEQTQIAQLKRQIDVLTQQLRDLNLHKITLDQSYTEQINLGVNAKLDANRLRLQLQETNAVLEQANVKIAALEKAIEEAVAGHRSK